MNVTTTKTRNISRTPMTSLWTSLARSWSCLRPPKSRLALVFTTITTITLLMALEATLTDAIPVVSPTTPHTAILRKAASLICAPTLRNLKMASIRQQLELSKERARARRSPILTVCHKLQLEETHRRYHKTHWALCTGLSPFCKPVEPFFKQRPQVAQYRAARPEQRLQQV